MAAVTKPSSELSFRARRVLYAVIGEYIATGEPVGSRRLSRRYNFNLSPASIRNVLSDLEDAGYLSQPHTSAGRVPTDAGFRLFVDALVQMREATADDQAAIVSRMQEMRPGEHDVIRETGRLLSALTGTASLVAPPRPQDEPLAQVRFVPLPEARVLAVLVFRSGVVQNRIVPLPSELDRSEIERLHNYLAELVEDRSLAETRRVLAEEMATKRADYMKLSQPAKRAVEQAVTEPEWAADVVIEGKDILFGRPEFEDAEKIRAFVRTFEEKELLLELLDRTLLAGGVQVLIGAEAELKDIEDVSLISANYRHRGGSTGTLAVIGPTRMDYAKVVPLVQFTARIMSRVLSNEDPED